MLNDLIRKPHIKPAHSKLVEYVDASSKGRVIDMPGFIHFPNYFSVGLLLNKFD